jgi:hypothetical protein
MSSLFSKYLVAPKLLYFFLNLSSYSSQVYIVQYLTQQGPLNISRSDYSLYALTAGALVHTVGAGFWTFLADHFKRPRLILALSAFLYMVCFQLFSLIDPNLSHGWKVFFVALVNSLQNACQAPLFPLFDGQVMAKLERLPNFSKDLFGRQRLWGTIGHSVCGYIMGRLWDQFGSPAMFYFNLATTCVFILSLFVLMEGDGQQQNSESEKPISLPPTTSPKDTSIVVTRPPSIIPPKSTGAQLKNLLLNKDFTFFLFVMFITGVAKHVLSSFSSDFIENHFKMLKSEVGLSLACHVLPEVLLFSSGKFWIKSIGVYWMLILAQLTTVIRVMAFAFVPTSWSFVAYMVETLKGVSTACLVLSGVRIAHDLAPPGLQSFAQGMYAATFHGLANFGTGIFSGAIMAWKSSAKARGTEELIATFTMTGYVSLAAMVLLVLKWSCVDRVLRIPFLSDYFDSRKSARAQTKCDV